MPTVGVTRACPPFALGFDCLEPVTGQVARMAKADGFVWVGRYVETLTIAERDTLFEAGLAIAPLSEAVTGVILTASLGTHLGQHRAADLQALECPPAVDLWADHEQPPPGSDSIAYLNARAAATIRAGYGAAQYVGLPNDLDGHQLYHLTANRYWKGGGRVPEPDCGWCIVQCEPLDVVRFAGQKIDVDIVKQDYLGRVPFLWYPS